MGFPSWVGFLFGIPFVAAGALIVLMGTKLVPVERASVHAPYWVLTVAGVSFVLGGLMVWGMALETVWRPTVGAGRPPGSIRMSRRWRIIPGIPTGSRSRDGTARPGRWGSPSV